MASTRSYTFDRRADPKRARLSQKPSHDEARMVMASQAVKNTVLPEVNEVITRRQPRKPYQTSLFNSERWVTWLGATIGSGQYGTAFRCQVTDAAFRALELVRSVSTFWVENRGVKAGTTVVVKVTRDRRAGVPQGTLDQFALDNIKEATLHKHLDASKCLNLGMAPLCVSSYVPDLYWAGLFFNQATGTRCYVTVMGVAPGIPVGVYLKRRRLDADTFLRIERAAAALWSQGVVHADLHKDNMMIDPATKKLTVIDFGFGVLLPPAYTVAVRNQLAKAVRSGVRSLGEMWLDTSKGFGLGIQRYVNQVQRGRGVAWYNPDGHAAMMLYKRLPQTERRLVPELRRRMWGAATSSAMSRSSDARSSVARSSDARSSVASSVARSSVASSSTARSSMMSRLLPPRQAAAQAAIARQQAARQAVAQQAAAGGVAPRQRRRWLPRLRIPFMWQRRRTPVMVYPSPVA